MAADSHIRWRRAIRFALITFLIFSFLPVWTAWYFGSWEATGDLASFWTMLASAIRATKQRDAWRLITDFYGAELVKLAVLMGVALAVGWWRAGRSE